MRRRGVRLRLPILFSSAFIRGSILMDLRGLFLATGSPENQVDLKDEVLLDIRETDREQVNEQTDHSHS